ncbi:MAG TPA: hypothetical protein VFC58_15890 [Desulfosporosinus sp.]|nr:hypothetical protein [Desulfosporosinus sp.]
MARKLRVWWPGAGYHIMCRGNHRLEIFRDDEFPPGSDRAPS